MKKILFSLLCTLCLCNLWAQNECDAIVTKENFQIQCIINSINDSVISYLDCSDGFASSQYQGLRDALIKAAKMANNQADGVILTLVNGGIDKAHIIKFKDASEDHSLARAKRYRGVYIFCDCEPLNSYRYLGDLKGKFTLNPQYTVLRDDMLKKCVKHYDNANGIILHLVLGGKDTAEAIKF